MDILDLMSRLGISGSTSVLLYIIMQRNTEQRKEKRDAELQILESKVTAIKESLTKHIAHHQSFEQNICNKFDKLYDRLNPLCDNVSRMLGIFEAKNDKDK